jgi:2-haloacid dehalogenase
MAESKPIDALIFDAYGTLFDVHSVIGLCDQLFPGHGALFSQTWRTKQLEYTWLTSLMGRYQDFWALTGAALEFACKALAIPLQPAARARLMDAYLHLELFPEVSHALQGFAGRRLAILSNGSRRMLAEVVKNAGVAAAFERVISVDEVGIYKPHPRVYELGPLRLGVDRRAIGFVSSNGWDITGAANYGFRTYWVNRSGLPAEELGVVPDATVKHLAELPPLLPQIF